MDKNSRRSKFGLNKIKIYIIIHPIEENIKARKEMCVWANKGMEKKDNNNNNNAEMSPPVSVTFCGLIST